MPRWMARRESSLKMMSFASARVATERRPRAPAARAAAGSGLPAKALA
jgi:hypothetical protein